MRQGRYASLREGCAPLDTQEVRSRRQVLAAIEVAHQERVDHPESAMILARARTSWCPEAAAGGRRSSRGTAGQRSAESLLAMFSRGADLRRRRRPHRGAPSDPRPAAPCGGPRS